MKRGLTSITYKLCARLFFTFLIFFNPFWAAAPKRMMSNGHRGEFPHVRPSVLLSLRPSVLSPPVDHQIVGTQIDTLRGTFHPQPPHTRPVSQMRVFTLFGQRTGRGQWPMLSHIGEITPPSFPYVPPLFWGSNPGLQAQISALRFKSQPPGSNLSLKSQPQGSNPSLEAQISASRIKPQFPGSNPSLKAQIPTSRHKPWPSASNPSY